MKLGNRIYYDKESRQIIHQTGEHSGTLFPHPVISEILYIDIPFGSINYNTHYVAGVDESGKLVFAEYEREQSETELENARLKDDILLLQTENEVGGIL